jgi:ubiquinone/menaquinone biosynthesis C-methylase UbiE
MRKGKFDISHYTDWNKKRIEAILDYYGEDFFKGKKVLEVGCGWADMGAFFQSIGADVTVSDAREEHINVIKERHPELKVLVVDCEDTEWKYPEESYDIIIHFGVLYHLANPDESINLVSKHCDTLIIETIVSDSDDPENILFRKEQTNWEKGAWGMAHSGTGNIPSYGYVEAHLKKNGLEVTRIPKPEMCNSGAHNYSWPRKNEGEFKPAQRAMWFCKKQK